MLSQTRLDRGLNSAFLLFRQARHAGDIQSAAVRMIRAPSTKHVNIASDAQFLVAARLTNFEPLSTISGGTSVVVMLIIGMGTDSAKSALTRAGGHSTSIF